ncbi:integrase [Streptacidiphilus cavernicola]|uniref:Integrase n=1 Tax=Streptacidiphilus cavernicola TaxID=3342716 RepID=A0ABV6VZ53_9ACTN
MPPSTRRAYKTCWRNLEAWCRPRGLEPFGGLTPSDLIEWTVHLTTVPSQRTGELLSPSHIGKHLSAVTAYHRAGQLPAPDGYGARKILESYEQRLALENHPKATPRKASAAVPRALRKLTAVCDPATTIGVRDRCIQLLGMCLAARASDLVAIGRDRIRVDPDGRGIAVLVYRRKVKKWAWKGIPYGSHPDTCPVRATIAWLDLLDKAGFTEGPVFLRVDRHGNIAHKIMRKGREVGDPTGRLSTEAVSDVIERAADRADLPGRWRSHSLRRGLVNAARANGADLVDIGRHGDWADGSKELIGYIDEADIWDTEHNVLYGIGL